jgi:hypothetical protein
MKIVIDINKDYVIQRLEYFLRTFIIFAYKWLTTDGEVLGYILGFLHFITSIFIFILLVVSHTIYPAFWLQVVVFVLLLTIWIQHVVLKVCISVVAEKAFTENESPFHKLLEDLFGISSTDFSNYLVTVETVAIGCFGLELIANISKIIHNPS